MNEVTELVKLLTAIVTFVTALIGLSKARGPKKRRKKKGRKR